MRKRILCIAMTLFITTASHLSMTSYAAVDTSETLEKHYDTYKEWWILDESNPEIAGKKFNPDKETKKLLEDAEKRGLEESFARFASEQEHDSTYYQQIAQTPSFKLFYVGPDNKMILKPEDSDYIFIDAPAYSVHEEAPTCIEYDLDEDGENELLITLHVLHGTGYNEDASFIADTDSKNQWNVYWIDPKFYMPAIADHVEAKVSGDKATLYVDGKKEGEPVEIKTDETAGYNCGLYLENFISIDIYDGKLWIASKPVFDPGFVYGPEILVWHCFIYEGEGKFTPDKVTATPNGFNYYYDTIDSFTKKELFCIWQNPNFELPLILTADEADIIGDKSKTYSLQVSSCNVSVLKNGKLELIGSIKGASAKYPLSYSPDGPFLANEHSMYIFKPDLVKKALVIKDGLEDNTMSNFSNHKGYIRIRDNKAENISKAEYEVLFKRFEDTIPILFDRGMK